MRNGGKLVILLVDDSAVIMEKMLGILNEIENIQIVFQASGYDEAVTIIEEAEPDIVLMDIFLGDRIGFDLLRFVTIKYPSTETIVFTNHSGQHYRNNCKKIGADHFLDKSNDFDLIPKIINRRSDEKKN